MRMLMGCFIARLMGLGMWMGMIVVIFAMPVHMRMNDDLTAAAAFAANFGPDFADADAFGAILRECLFFGHAMLPSYLPRMGGGIRIT